MIIVNLGERSEVKHDCFLYQDVYCLRFKWNILHLSVYMYFTGRVCVSHGTGSLTDIVQWSAKKKGFTHWVLEFLADSTVAFASAILAHLLFIVKISPFHRNNCA